LELCISEFGNELVGYQQNDELIDSNLKAISVYHINILKMKNKAIWISIFAFFFIIQTAYYWEGKSRAILVPASLILIFTYLTLLFVLLKQIVLLFKRKFSEKNRVFLIMALASVLFLTAYAPHGLIDFDQLEGKDILIAGREGSANCTTTLKLKENGKFSTTIICFGMERMSGKYHIKKDTVFFDYDNNKNTRELYQFALVDSTLSWNKKDGLFLYKNKNDKSPNQLIIVLNEIKLKQSKPNPLNP